MKRFHVHVAVEDLDQSIRFYSTLFAAEPAVVKSDYAKWMLDDPRVNFAISRRGEQRGVDHLGLQVDDHGELTEISDRLDSAGRELYGRGVAHCCYARSDKAWVQDPQGVSWETFFTFGQETTYGEGTVEQAASAPACCGESTCGSAGPERTKAEADACCAA
ncbi:MAG TPA: ArsI/CadI family heavy metal resistance metalloenzyme [Dongiaceae bacterium]|jgi:catechol 2,3-dioxygenase-like lactoylglutathione lyase family enzyme|nr:ArsI/CadI family heavy metal resistance metalloenzyme [Dongiaceae bacterium]